MSDYIGCLNVSCHIFCVSQFHNAMEEFSKALLEKKYVDAANQLERVRAAYIMSTQFDLYSEQTMDHCQSVLCAVCRRVFCFFL